MQRLETVRVEATYTRTVDVNRFQNKQPLLLTGEGTLIYRSDGERWFKRDDGFSYRAGVAEARAHQSDRWV